MSQDFEKLFSQLDCVAPPSRLLTDIRQRLEKERKKRFLRKRFAGVFSVAVMLISVPALIFAGVSLNSSLTSSGFWNFLSLAFSDFDVVSGYWSNFLWSLLEALPLLTLALFFGALFSFAEAARILSLDCKFMFWRVSRDGVAGRNL